MTGAKILSQLRYVTDYIQYIPWVRRTDTRLGIKTRGTEYRYPGRGKCRIKLSDKHPPAPLSRVKEKEVRKDVGRKRRLIKERIELATEALHAALSIGDVIEFGLVVLAL
jgi:hypothetical protein